MFDTLTDDERHALNHKLYEWGHRFAEVGLPLTRVSLAVYGSDASGILWDQGIRYYDLMNEMYDLRAEVAV